MKKVFLFILTSVCIDCYAQDFDNLMVKKQLDCSDVSYNSALLFEKYFTESQVDSARSLLAYWEDKCGHREPVHRAKLLLALKENEYQDSLLTENVLSYIFNYQNRMDMIKSGNYYSYDNYKPYFGYVPAGQNFDKFTQKEFENLKSNYDTNKIEYLLCEFYSDNCDTIFSKLQSDSYQTTTLSKEYDKTVKRYLNLTEMNFAFITGIWIPTGKLTTLGLHPEIGLQWGAKHKKMNYDFTVAGKFIHSANEYYARRSETSSPELTNHFFGVYFGIDVGRDIYINNGHELQITGGVALDGFDALAEDKNKNLESASVLSYNFNLGIGYRYYISNSFYLGLRAKYNIVDYTSNNVIDFTGNPITVQFTIGGLYNIFKEVNLKALKYKYRK